MTNFSRLIPKFQGIMRAFRETKTKLKENKTKIFVRRGGPNHLEGLRYAVMYSKVVAQFSFKKIHLLTDIECIVNILNIL